MEVNFGKHASARSLPKPVTEWSHTAYQCCEYTNIHISMWIGLMRKKIDSTSFGGRSNYLFASCYPGGVQRGPQLKHNGHCQQAPELGWGQSPPSTADGSWSPPPPPLPRRTLPGPVANSWNPPPAPMPRKIPTGPPQLPGPATAPLPHRGPPCHILTRPNPTNESHGQLQRQPPSNPATPSQSNCQPAQSRLPERKAEASARMEAQRGNPPLLRAEPLLVAKPAGQLTVPNAWNQPERMKALIQSHTRVPVPWLEVADPGLAVDWSVQAPDPRQGYPRGDGGLFLFKLVSLTNI